MTNLNQPFNTIYNEAWKMATNGEPVQGGEWANYYTFSFYKSNFIRTRGSFLPKSQPQQKNKVTNFQLK